MSDIKNLNGIHHDARIVFVEPNDVYDKDADNASGDVSLTPRYEDFCISFNLIIEAFSRFKSSGTSNIGGDGQESKKYVIQWGMTKEEMVKKRTSVLQGNRGIDVLNNDDGSFSYSDSNYNYLTTYYTDITYDSYRERTEIEGLGVESVQISYESWYTPTVTIKFIDVRGSSLFGREEAIHVDGQLTAENIFGAFFTMPYPLFRLQVKGFFGKPVTYQLACSGFKGEFNSQTGNFEAVATFIGYSWSLLTDIPFVYLVAAPNASYIGSDYWERHKSTKAWGLWDDGNALVEPPKLYNLFRWIKSADERIKQEESIATSEQNEILQSIENEKKLLNDLRTNINAFISAIETQLSSNYLGLYYDEDEKKQQLLLFSEGDRYKPNDQTMKAYNDMYICLKQYTELYSGRGITVDKSPNQWKESFPKDIVFLDKFQITVDTSTNVVRDIKLKELSSLTLETMKSLDFNDKKGKLSRKTAEQLFNAINGEQKDNHIKKYVYLIDFYDVSSLINDRLKQMSAEEEKLIKQINERVNYSIKSIVSFKPYIGNVFKIIFCHLETFCHIMFDSADEIYAQMHNGQRDPSYLGVNVENTDTNPNLNKSISPWPAVFSRGEKTKDCGYVSNIENVYGWVGDLSDRFVEEKVVYAIQDGVEHILEEMKDTSYASKNSTFPVMPMDFTKNSSPFDIVSNSNISDLSGYLAMRAAAIIGVMSGNNINVSLAQELGKLDAYNFYSSVGSPSALKSLFSDKNVDVIKGITYCDQEYDKWAFCLEEGTNKMYHKFETAKKFDSEHANNNRKPMFKKNNGNNLFVHWYDNNGLTYVPTSLSDYMSYKDDFTYVSKDNNFYFEPNIHSDRNGRITARDWLCNCNSVKIGVLNIEEGQTDSENQQQDGKYRYEKYVNKKMFNIIKESDAVNGIFEKYDQLVTGGCKIGEYEVKDDLSDFLKTYMKVGKVYRTKFFNRTKYMLSGNIEKIGYNEMDLLANTLYGKSKKKYNFTNGDWNLQLNPKLTNAVSFNDNGDFTFNGEEISYNDLVIQQFKIWYFGDVCNLFGCPFYYLQNTRKVVLEKNNDGHYIAREETDDEYNYRTLRVKALLFLHTFKYDYLHTELNVFSKNKRVGGLEAVPKGYLLFMGAMLWRRKFAREHKDDDPIIYSNSQINEPNVFKRPDIDKSFLVNNNGFLQFQVWRDKNTTKYVYGIDNLFSGLTEIDYNIENQLLDLFDEFAVNTFSQIKNKYELRNKITNEETKEYTSVTIRNDIKKLLEYTNDYYNKKMNSIEFERWLRNFGIDNWAGNYSSINVNTKIDGDNQGFKLLFNEKDTRYQELFKDLYCGYYVVSDSCYKRLTKEGGEIKSDDKIWVNNDLYDAYIGGFLNASNDIIRNDENSYPSNANTFVPEHRNKNRDLYIPMYYYLKNLWDRWLVISDTSAFDVSNFFDKNFVFIDSFYRNINNKLAVNCQLFLDKWEGAAKEASLFNFLSALLKEHDCMFMPVPDYAGFNGEDMDKDVETMKDLFRPLPYLSVEEPSNSNKFVIIYVYPAGKASEDNGYQTDTYDIWSHKDGFTQIAKSLFSKSNVNKDIGESEDYIMPSFAVAFGRQNNHIFKNLKLTMDSPAVTEQAINALSNIIEKGRDSGRKVTFVGQDTFNVFTNYSYSVDVEMLGNAQICPLMYFQLMNVPLWRGTYMIYKVSHNMTPGNMTTSFTGVKMSKFARPFNTTFICYEPREIVESNTSQLSEECSYETSTVSFSDIPFIDGEYGTPGMFTGIKDREKKWAMCGITRSDMQPNEVFNEGLIVNVTFNQTGGTKTLPMNKYIAEDFKKICDEILALGWFNLNVGNCYRAKNSLSGGRVSRHCWGIAVDINPGSGGNPWFATHIQEGQKEPAQGSGLPWPIKMTPYRGLYDRSKCVWNWEHPVVKIFLAHGWGWGGAYGDTMHFSVDEGH